MSAVTGGPATAPPPPAFPTDKEIAADYHEGDRFVQRLWDHIFLQEDGIDRLRLKTEIVFAPGVPWTWYCQVNPAARKMTPTITNIGKAEKVYLDTTLDNAIAHDWLVEKNGKLYVGPVSLPEHKPLQTVGGEEGAVNFILESENDKAFAELRKKTGVGRRTRSAPMRVELVESIKKFGQANPIIKWQPRGQTVIITVDGATREEICGELGIEPWVVFLAPETPATTVLALRIETERVCSTKSQAEEARTRWIESLRVAGISTEEIARMVGLSKSRVAGLLQASGKGRRLFTDADKAEVLRLHADGLKPQKIASLTQWGKDAIYKTLVEAREAATPLATVTPLPTATPAAKPSKPRLPTKQNGAHIDEIAAKYGFTPVTVQKTSAKKAASVIEARVDARQEILRDWQDAFWALLDEAVKDPKLVEMIRDRLP